MTLTQKETIYLKDYQNQERLCIEKYSKNAENACSPGLAKMFNSIASEEQTHLDTISDMLQGKIPSVGGSSNKYDEDSFMNTYTYNETDKKKDQYLCNDCLGTEKHASSSYNTGIFEFNDFQMRDVLNHIQKEEQHHGAMISKYMNMNGMIC